MSTKRDIQHNEPRSAAMMIIAMAIFGTIGIFRKMIPLSSAWVAFFRGGIGSIALALFMMSRPKSRAGKPDGTTVLWLIITGALIGVNWALLFEAYNYTTVSVATLCYYMAPTFVIILSSVILREKLTPVKAACTVISLAGMVLVSGIADGVLAGAGVAAQSGAAAPEASSASHGIYGLIMSGLSGEARGILFGLAAAVLYASVVLANKSMKPADPYVRTLIQLVSATVVLIPYLILKDGAPDAVWSIELISLLITVGIVHTGLSYALYFGSMDGLKTHTIAIFSYIDPVTALVLSHFILHEELTFLGIFGAVMILGSALVSGIRD